MDVGLLLTIIWPYLAVFYLVDCLQVVRGGFIVFSGAPRSGMAVRGAGLRLAGLLPWHWSVPKSREPQILSPAGIYVRTTPYPDFQRPPLPEDFAFVSWDDLGTVRHEGRKVVLGGWLAVTLASRAEASTVCRRIGALRDCPKPDRPAAIRSSLTGSFDAKAVREEVKRTQAASLSLVIVSSALFVGTLAVLPASLLFRLPSRALWMEGAVLLTGWLAVVLLWWRAHRALLPGAAGDRLEEALLFVLFPVASLHAFGKLTRRLLAPYESPALVTALAPARARDALRKEYVRAQAAVCGGPQDFAAAWSMRAALLKDLAAEAGLDLAGEAALEDGAPELGATCPLCGSEYRPGFGTCADCGVSLRQGGAL